MIYDFRQAFLVYFLVCLLIQRPTLLECSFVGIWQNNGYHNNTCLCIASLHAVLEQEICFRFTPTGALGADRTCIGLRRLVEYSSSGAIEALSV
jgi:hypothetical protein